MRLALKLQQWYLSEKIQMRRESLQDIHKFIIHYETSQARLRMLEAVGSAHLTRKQRTDLTVLREDNRNPQAREDYKEYVEYERQLEAAIVRLEERLNTVVKKLTSS